MHIGLRRLIVTGLLLSAAVWLSGCNTVKGLGQDIYQSADYVQEQMFY